MLTFANAAILAEYLRRAEYAHKVSGQPNAGWSDWYAKWISSEASYTNGQAKRKAQVFLPGDIAPTVAK